jgi:hypothetical protein
MTTQIRKARIAFIRASYIHVHSMRLASGHEALVARVLAQDGKIGYGFTMRLDAGEARRMAEWHAGMRSEKPHLEPLLGHPWEKAFLEGQPIPWACEPAFTALEFLPPRPPGSSASTR